MNGLLNAGDLHLVTVRDEVAGMLFPSKYPAALAVGKPVLLAGGQGTTVAEEITREGLGFACRHDAGQIARCRAWRLQRHGSIAACWARTDTGYSRNGTNDGMRRDDGPT